MKETITFAKNNIIAYEYEISFLCIVSDVFNNGNR